MQNNKIKIKGSIQNKCCPKILFPLLILFCNKNATARQRKWRKEKFPLRNNILKPLYFHNTNITL